MAELDAATVVAAQRELHDLLEEYLRAIASAARAQARGVPSRALVTVPASGAEVRAPEGADYFSLTVVNGSARTIFVSPTAGIAEAAAVRLGNATVAEAAGVLVIRPTSARTVPVGGIDLYLAQDPAGGAAATVTVYRWPTVRDFRHQALA